MNEKVRKGVILILFVLAVFYVIFLINSVFFSSKVLFSPAMSIERTIFNGENMKNVYLSIDSDLNVIAIREDFSGCNILSYSFSQDTDFFEFKENESTFILINKDSKISGDLNYNLSGDCSINGQFSEDGINWEDTSQGSIGNLTQEILPEFPVPDWVSNGTSGEPVAYSSEFCTGNIYVNSSRDGCSYFSNQYGLTWMCGSIPGCSINGNCVDYSGISDQCSQITSEYECNSVYFDDGNYCSWAVECSGQMTNRSCGIISDEGICNSVRGCSWDIELHYE